MSAWEAAVGASDEWYTPPEVFDALGCRFDMDVAAPADSSALALTHVPADRFITAKSLAVRWSGFVWMNPPFGGRNSLQPWLAKFFDHGNGIALTPDRTSAPWFAEAWARADQVLFTAGKLKFLRPDGSVGKQPGTGTALWAVGSRGIAALDRAAAHGLGILAAPVRLPAVLSAAA